MRASCLGPGFNRLMDLPHDPIIRLRIEQRLFDMIVAVLTVKATPSGAQIRRRLGRRGTDIAEGPS